MADFRCCCLSTACQQFSGQKGQPEKHPDSNAPSLFLLVLINVSVATIASILMLSRGRPCLRRHLPAVYDTVAAGSDEPLLFLYPRWAAPALRQRRSISCTATEVAAGKRHVSGTSFRSVIHGCPSFARHSCRWISDTPSRNPDSTSVSSSATEENNPKTKDQNFNESDGLGESVGDPSASHREQWDKSLLDTKHTAPRRPLRGYALKRARRVEMSLQKSQSKKAEYEALTPRQRFVRATSSRDQRKIQARKYMKKQHSKHSLPYIEKAWLDTKDLLEGIKHTNRARIKYVSRQKEIFVAEETLALFAGVNQHTFQENIWYMLINNGCRVQVLPVRENNGCLRRVVLSGTERAVELVEARFTHAQKLQEAGDPLVDMHRPIVPIYSSRDAMSHSGLPVPLIRGVWFFEDSKDSRLTFDQAMLARPMVTSIKEFNEHVEDVTSSRLPSLHEKAMNPSKEPQVERITKHLIRLFDSNQPYLSTAALHLALAFLCEHESIYTARALSLRTKHVATVQTYNIMLKIAAQHQDLVAFRNLVRDMGRANINPNPETWLILLSALVKPSEKAELIGHMVQHNYMSDINTIRGALKQTIQDSLLVHLDSGKDIDEFIDLMVNTHGANWFSSSLMGQMFSTLARLKDTATLERLVQICFDRRISLDAQALASLFEVYRSNVFTAVRYMLRFIQTPWFHSSAHNLERLFFIAFKSRHYNISLVLWRYACMHQNVTWKMKQAVLVSLCRNKSLKKTNELNTLWNSDAGKVIVGIDFHHESYDMSDSIMNEIPAEFHHNPLLFLVGWKPAGEERSRQIRVAKALVQRDIDLSSLYKPQYPFRIMLDAAALLDAEWHNVPRPMTWKIQNAIQVSVVHKAKYPEGEHHKRRPRRPLDLNA